MLLNVYQQDMIIVFFLFALLRMCEFSCLDALRLFTIRRSMAKNAINFQAVLKIFRTHFIVPNNPTIAVVLCKHRMATKG